MVNVIWLLLLLSGILVAALNGNLPLVTTAAFDAVTYAVKVAIELIGVISLWLGLLKIAERANLVRLISKLVAPVASLIFPEVPRNHPAFFAIIMNLAANVLGLGNAATPFGLKAMEHLQELNSQKDTASPAMITFLALNTSCITLVPTLVISLRSQAGSADPAEIIGATVLATCCGTVFAIFLNSVLKRKYFHKKY